MMWRLKFTYSDGREFILPRMYATQEDVMAEYFKLVPGMQDAAEVPEGSAEPIDEN